MGVSALSTNYSDPHSFQRLSASTSKFQAPKACSASTLMCYRSYVRLVECANHVLSFFSRLRWVCAFSHHPVGALASLSGSPSEVVGLLCAEEFPLDKVNGYWFGNRIHCIMIVYFSIHKTDLTMIKWTIS